MSILRTIAAVIVGYIVYAFASMVVISLLVPRQGAVFVALALVALAAIGLVSGIITSVIAGRTRRLAGYIVAGLVALATVANLVAHLGAEPTWYKVGTLALTVPGILWVGLRNPR